MYDLVTRPRLPILTTSLFLILSIIACGIDFGGSSSEQNVPPPIVVTVVVTAPPIEESDVNEGETTSGLVAFSVKNELYVARPDGSDSRRLVKTKGDIIFGISWSPNADKLAFFSSNSEDPGQAYVVNSDGSNLVQISLPDEFPSAPNWSPDGQKLAYAGNFANDDPEIFLVNPDGSDRKQLTDNEARDSGPVWSPDQNLIAFESNREGNPQLYLMNSDGSSQRLLTPDLGNYIPWNEDPFFQRGYYWSHDNTRLAISFASLDTLKFLTLIADVETGNLSLLNQDNERVSVRGWFPDDSFVIAKVFDPDTEASGIYKISSSGQRILLSNALDLGRNNDNQACVFSPDGSRIIADHVNTSGQGDAIHILDMNDTTSALDFTSRIRQVDYEIYGYCWSPK
jgi:TolB protein